MAVVAVVVYLQLLLYSHLSRAAHNLGKIEKKQVEIWRWTAAKWWIREVNQCVAIVPHKSHFLLNGIIAFVSWCCCWTLRCLEIDGSKEAVQQPFGRLQKKGNFIDYWMDALEATALDWPERVYDFCRWCWYCPSPPSPFVGSRLKVRDCQSHWAEKKKSRHQRSTMPV